MEVRKDISVGIRRLWSVEAVRISDTEQQACSFALTIPLSLIPVQFSVLTVHRQEFPMTPFLDQPAISQ